MTLFFMVPQEDRQDVEERDFNNPFLVRGSPSHVWQHVKADGKEIDVLTFWRNTMFCDRPAQLVAIVDVTAKRQAEARIAHMAHHDALTGLPNRVLFHERLDEALLRVRRYAEILAVLYLDLDQFKSVNDTLGHPAGDKLLVAVAERLRTCLRDCDMVARFGGDEFAVVLEASAARRGRDATALARFVVNELSDPILRGGRLPSAHYRGERRRRSCRPTAAMITDPLLRSADIALYFVKAEGRQRLPAFGSRHGKYRPP